MHVDTGDTVLLRANEELLRSKGFLLFVVQEDGSLCVIGDSKRLSMKEKCQLEDYHQTFSSILNEPVT